MKNIHVGPRSVSGTAVYTIFWLPGHLGDENSPGLTGCCWVMLCWLWCWVWPCANKGGNVTDRLGNNLHSMSLLHVICGGKVMRVRSWLSPRTDTILEGHTIGQVLASAKDQCVGGPLCPSLFLGCFPLISWAETAPSLQLNQKSNVPLGHVGVIPICRVKQE